MPEQQEVAAIPLVEETLSIGKKQVEAERLKVRVSVKERHDLVPVELHQDALQIERVPKNIPVSELPSVRHEGNLTIIPVVEEEVVIEKRLVLVEEIHVLRTSTTSTEQVPVVLRSEEAKIERESLNPVPASGKGIDDD